MDIIAFHNSCPDGFTAAYICKLKYPAARLLPLDHGIDPNPIIEQFKDKNVIMVDWSFRTKEQNRSAFNSAKSFRILDHHKTAESELFGEPFAIFDMGRSGAGLTWDYLFGRDSTGEWTRDREEREGGVDIGEPRPFYVSYVEDRDLWRFKLPESEAVNAFIMARPYEIKAWDELAKTDLNDAIVQGKAILRQINKYVNEAVRQAQSGTLNLDGKHYTVGVVNCLYMNVSEIGHALAHRYDIGMGWFERHDGITQFSMRSLGDIDVSVIAKHFGGGGHRNAAGFQLTLDKGRDLLDNILGRKNVLN